LGNPGEKYANTRHNVGTWWLLKLAEQHGLVLRAESKFQGWAAKLPRGDTWLLIPATYMNHSGQPVSALARFYKIPAEEILIVYDELDLDPGAVKLKFGGGVSGHNGLKDIVAHLGSPSFWRLRLGIGKPDNDGVNYVLSAPRAEEFDRIESAIARSLDVFPLMHEGKWEAAMLKLHTKGKDEGGSMKDEKGKDEGGRMKDEKSNDEREG
jgi:PTH1 family peptidyl-tRNA hydrolase